MKKNTTRALILVLALTLTFALAGCGSKETGSDTTIKVGATPAPHAEVLEVIADDLAEEGYTLEIVEYNDYILAVKLVNGVDEAIAHINKYNTKHSEAIVTDSYTKAQKFLNEVDAAAVYVNASTRFTDGFEFGFGAEIGISTQKMHARGPMGLKEMTSYKYTIRGNGQVR